jgi:hypothetical protein
LLKKPAAPYDDRVIISYEHRFVFVKTRKTAGTSLEVFLARLAGPDAVVTPVSPEVPGHLPRNYESLRNPLKDALLKARQRRLPGEARQRPAYFNHMHASSIRKRLGRRRWNSYFTFCFERNPWDKVVSRYYFATGRGEFDGTFRDFVLGNQLESDFDHYSFDGQTVGVDFVGRYEQLEQDLQWVLDRLEITEPIQLSREKGNYRPAASRTDARFDPEMSEKVQRFYAREIRAFGYTPPAALIAR